MPRVDRMALANIPPKPVGHAAMAVIDATQAHRPEVQLMAMGCAFITACTRAGIEPQNVATMARNLMGSNEAEARAELRALREYMEGEL